MEIIQLNQNDIIKYFEALLELKYRSISLNFCEGDYSNLKETCREKLLELPGYIEDGKAVVFGAISNNVMVGFLWAYPRTFFNQPRMFINGIAVIEEAVGTGVAKMLVNELKEYASNHGYHGIDLTVAPFNEKAVGFYRHLGFEDERIQMRLPL